MNSASETCQKPASIPTAHNRSLYTEDNCKEKMIGRNTKNFSCFDLKKN
jgi:hypothetical protein